MRRTLGLAAIIATCFVPVARAEPSMMLYMGEVDCGSWIEMSHVPSDNIQKAVSLNLILGTINGAQIYEGELYNGIKPASIAAWMDKYCAANPLANIVTGSHVLIKELKAKRYKKK